MTTKNYYQILQVDPSADPEVITAAYKRLSAKFHPDKNPSVDAVQRMSEINLAYETLKNPEKRVQYDKRSTSIERSARTKQSRNKVEDEKIDIERDEDSEELYDIEIVSCTAYCKSGDIKVYGELASMTMRPIRKYREIHVVVYDVYGDILARRYTNWSEFGLRQSFDLNLENQNPSRAPVRVKVFPGGRL